MRSSGRSGSRQAARAERRAARSTGVQRPSRRPRRGIRRRRPTDERQVDERQVDEEQTDEEQTDEGQTDEGQTESAVTIPHRITVVRAEDEAPTLVPPRSPAAIFADPQAAAFFDLDNTVVQGASLFHLAKGLYRRNFFPARLIVKAVWLQTYFRLVGREEPEHIRQAREAALSFIAGHTVAEIQSVGREIYEESIAPRIWPGTRALAQLHLDVGQRVWLVTAAPVEMAGIIAERLGLTGALGTTADHVDGVYTGRLDGELLHGQAKAEAVRALAAEHGLDLAHCFAYSDSANDLPMLSLVGHPCAINPDARLTRHAEDQGWQIRDFRTHRRAAKVGLLGTGMAGAAAGAVATGLAVRRKLRHG